MAGILYGNHRGCLARRREAIDSFGEPLVDVEHPVAERVGLGCPEEMPVVLQLRTAAGGVDEDGRVAGDRIDDTSRERTGIVGEPRVHGERSTTSCSVSGQGNTGSGGLEHTLCSSVRGPRPGVHDTAGEQPDVVPARLQGRSTQGDDGQPETSGRDDTQPLPHP